MTLLFDVQHRAGSFNLDAKFTAGNGLTALFGRSGSGKTTIVNIIAGLIGPDQGRVVVDGLTLFDSKRGVFLPAHRRRVGYVFQDARLFPHLTVKQNLLYGRWFSPQPSGPDEFDRVTELLALSKLLERSPGRLSGGETRRVAIGRALLSGPRVLLMDEPFASLDDTRKQEILPYLERLRDSGRVPIVYVTHAVAEVVRLASTIVVISDGRVVGSGTASEVMQRIDLFPVMGAAEAGALVEATVASHDERFDLTVLSSKAGLWRVPRLNSPPGRQVRIRVRAIDVMLAVTEPSGVSALNVFRAAITVLGAPNGPSIDVQLDCSGDVINARVTRLSAERLCLQAGKKVFALIKSVAIDPQTFNRGERQPSSG